jgi:hypothetical protein
MTDGFDSTVMIPPPVLGNVIRMKKSDAKSY